MRTQNLFWFDTYHLILCMLKVTKVKLGVLYVLLSLLEVVTWVSVTVCVVNPDVEWCEQHNAYSLINIVFVDGTFK